MERSLLKARLGDTSWCCALGLRGLVAFCLSFLVWGVTWAEARTKEHPVLLGAGWNLLVLPFDAELPTRWIDNDILVWKTEENSEPDTPSVSEMDAALEVLFQGTRYWVHSRKKQVLDLAVRPHPGPGPMPSRPSQSETIPVDVHGQEPAPRPGAFETASIVDEPNGITVLPRVALSESDGHTLAHVAYGVRAHQRPKSDGVWYRRSAKAGKPRSFDVPKLVGATQHGWFLTEVEVAARDALVSIAWVETNAKASAPSSAATTGDAPKAEALAPIGVAQVWITQSRDGGRTFAPAILVRDGLSWQRGLDMAYDPFLGHHLVFGEGGKVYYLADLSGEPATVFDLKKRVSATEVIKYLRRVTPRLNGRCDCPDCWCEESYSVAPDTPEHGGVDSDRYRTEESYVVEPTLCVDGRQITIAARQIRMWDNQPVLNQAWGAMLKSPVYQKVPVQGQFLTRPVVGWRSVWKTAYEPGDEDRYAKLGFDHQFLYGGTWHEVDEIKVARRPLASGTSASPPRMDEAWNENDKQSPKSWHLSSAAVVGQASGDNTPSHPRLASTPTGLVLIYENGTSDDPNALGFNPIQVQTSTDGGHSWSAPKTVGTGYVPVAGVTENDHMNLLAYVPQTESGGSILAFHSPDGGHTFSDPFTLSSMPAKPVHWKSHGAGADALAGGVSLATHENLFFAAWIEKSPGPGGKDRLVTSRASSVSDVAHLSVSLPEYITEGRPSKVVVTAENIYHMRVNAEHVLRFATRDDGAKDEVAPASEPATYAPSEPQVVAVDHHGAVDERIGAAGGGSGGSGEEGHAGGLDLVSLQRGQATVWVEPEVLPVPKNGGRLGALSAAWPAALSPNESAGAIVNVSLAEAQGSQALEEGVPVFAASPRGNREKAEWMRDRLWRDGGVSAEGRPVGYQVEYQVVGGDAADEDEARAWLGAPAGEGQATDAQYLAAYERVWAYTQGIALAQYARLGTPRFDAKAQALARYLCARADRDRRGKKGFRSVIRGWPFSWNTSGDNWKDARLVTGATAWVIHGLGVFLVSDAFKALSEQEQNKQRDCYAEALEGLEDHRRFGTTEDGRKVSLMTAGWTARGLAFAHNPWELNPKRRPRLGAIGEAWDYYDVLDAIGYGADVGITPPEIRRHLTKADGSTVDLPPRVLSNADLSFIQETVQAGNVVTEHNLDVLSVLNHALNHSDELGIRDREHLEAWRNELREGIFHVLWDPNDVHWRRDLENARDAFGIRPEKRLEIEAALTDGVWGRVSTGGYMRPGGQQPPSPGVIRIDRGLLDSTDFVPNRRHTAIDNCSWLSLSVDYRDLEDPAKVDALARCLSFTSLAFGKHIEFRGHAYYGAHYFFDGFEDRYISATDRQELSFHLEATTGLIMGLLKFVAHHPSHPQSPGFRREVDALWAGVQDFVLDHGFPYSSQRILDLSTLLTSSTALIWFIDTHEAFYGRDPAFSQGGLSSGAALSEGPLWNLGGLETLVSAEEVCDPEQTVSIAGALADEGADLVGVQVCGEDRVVLRSQSHSVIKYRANPKAATQVGEAVLKLKKVLAAPPGEVNLLSEITSIVFGLGLSLSAGQQVVEWLAEGYGWRALRLYDHPPVGPWRSVGFAKVDALSGHTQDDVLGVVDIYARNEQGLLEPSAKLSHGQIYGIVVPSTIVPWVPQLPWLVVDPSFPYAEVFEYTQPIALEEPPSFAPETGFLLGDTSAQDLSSDDPFILGYRAWAKGGWLLLGQLQQQGWFQRLSTREQWAYLALMLDPKSHPWWPGRSSRGVVPPTWVHFGEPSNPLFVGVVLSEKEGGLITRTYIEPQNFVEGTWHAIVPGEHRPEYWAVKTEDLTKLPDHLRALQWTNGHLPTSGPAPGESETPPDTKVHYKPGESMPTPKGSSDGTGVPPVSNVSGFPPVRPVAYFGIPYEAYVAGLRGVPRRVEFLSRRPPADMFRHGLRSNETAKDFFEYLTTGRGGFHSTSGDLDSILDPKTFPPGQGDVYRYELRPPMGAIHVPSVMKSLGIDVPRAWANLVVLPWGAPPEHFSLSRVMSPNGIGMNGGPFEEHVLFESALEAPNGEAQESYIDATAIDDEFLQAMADVWAAKTAFLPRPLSVADVNLARHTAPSLVVVPGPQSADEPTGPFLHGLSPQPKTLGLRTLTKWEDAENALQAGLVKNQNAHLSKTQERWLYFVENDGRGLNLEPLDALQKRQIWFSEGVLSSQIIGAQAFTWDPTKERMVEGRFVPNPEYKKKVILPLIFGELRVRFVDEAPKIFYDESEQRSYVASDAIEATYYEAAIARAKKEAAHLGGQGVVRMFGGQPVTRKQDYPDNVEEIPIRDVYRKTSLPRYRTYRLGGLWLRTVLEEYARHGFSLSNPILVYRLTTGQIVARERDHIRLAAMNLLGEDKIPVRFVIPEFDGEDHHEPPVSPNLAPGTAYGVTQAAFEAAQNVHYKIAYRLNSKVSAFDAFRKGFSAAGEHTDLWDHLWYDHPFTISPKPESAWLTAHKTPASATDTLHELMEGYDFAQGWMALVRPRGGVDVDIALGFQYDQRSLLTVLHQIPATDVLGSFVPGGFLHVNHLAEDPLHPAYALATDLVERPLTDLNPRFVEEPEVDRYVQRLKNQETFAKPVLLLKKPGGDLHLLKGDREIWALTRMGETTTAAAVIDWSRLSAEQQEMVEDMLQGPVLFDPVVPDTPASQAPEIADEEHRFMPKSLSSMPLGTPVELTVEKLFEILSPMGVTEKHKAYGPEDHAAAVKLIWSFLERGFIRADGTFNNFAAPNDALTQLERMRERMPVQNRLGAPSEYEVDNIFTYLFGTVLSVGPKRFKNLIPAFGTMWIEKGDFGVIKVMLAPIVEQPFPYIIYEKLLPLESLVKSKPVKADDSEFQTWLQGQVGASWDASVAPAPVVRVSDWSRSVSISAGVGVLARPKHDKRWVREEVQDPRVPYPELFPEDVINADGTIDLRWLLTADENDAKRLLHALHIDPIAVGSFELAELRSSKNNQWDGSIRIVRYVDQKLKNAKRFDPNAGFSTP